MSDILRDTELNIIFIGESYLGGMAGSRRIQNIIDSLINSGNCTIHNLIIGNPNDKNKIEIKGTKNSVSYRKIYFHKTNPFSILRHFFLGFRFILNAKSKSKKNILYCYGSPTIINLPFLLYSKLIKIKVLVDIVEDNSLIDKESLNLFKKIKICFDQIIENYIHLYCDAVLVISSSLMTKIKPTLGKELPIVYLPISVNLRYFNLNNEYKINDKIRIFYGGSFGEKDGLLYLLKAFEVISESYKNTELILTGKADKRGMNYVDDYVNSSKAKSRMHYLGYLDSKDFYKWMQNCDIFCMTRINSRYANAGFPFKLGEMLATGKPVLATRVGDIEYYLENAKNAIIVEPNSVEAIVNGLIYLIENPEIAKEIGKNGRKTAIKYFDSEKIICSLYPFINSI